MIHCERCGSKFHSARAATIEDCPRCLLRDDVAAPLKVVEAFPSPKPPAVNIQAEKPTEIDQASPVAGV